MTVIFDGRKFAERKLAILKTSVNELKKKGINPCLASIYLSSDSASVIYTQLKKKVATSIGIEYITYEFKKKNVDEIIRIIGKLNSDKSIHGILVQKPSGINDFDDKDWQRIVSEITPEKDVDGLREESKFIPATIKAILNILGEALNIVRLPLKKPLKNTPYKVAVVGSRGMVGKPLIKELTNLGYEVIPCNSQTKDLQSEVLKGDIVISATGYPALIKGEIIKKGAIVIDVGSPKGEVDFETVKNIASFITPVPGGVGPVTIYCLLENLLVASKKAIC
jgi:methylenetetrahydrofolate dehydrogenase (NADP+)/methenyltetrahydrofolate cyclohydrolase